MSSDGSSERVSLQKAVAVVQLVRVRGLFVVADLNGFLLKIADVAVNAQKANLPKAGDGLIRKKKKSNMFLRGTKSPRVRIRTNSTTPVFVHREKQTLPSAKHVNIDLPLIIWYQCPVTYFIFLQYLVSYSIWVKVV